MRESLHLSADKVAFALHCSCLLQPRIGFNCVTWTSDYNHIVWDRPATHITDVYGTSDLPRLEQILRVKEKWVLRREFFKLESYNP